MPTPSIDQLKRAIGISEQIEKLQTELAGITGGSSFSSKVAASPIRKIGKGTMSPVTKDEGCSTGSMGEEEGQSRDLCF